MPREERRDGGDEFIWLLKVDKEKQVEALYSQIELRVTQVEEQIDRKSTRLKSSHAR